MSGKDQYQIEQRKPRRREASPTKLTRFEKNTGRRIPHEYRKFLLCQNGGVPIRRNITFGKNAYEDTVLRSFFGVSGTSNLATILDIYADRIPAKTFPIADDEFDNLILISERGNTNPIVFWDHEKELERTKPTRIAPTLLAFLAMLRLDRIVEFEIATITYRGGLQQRCAQPERRFLSVDRNTVVTLRELKVGERINEFGELRTIVKIEFTKEAHSG